MTHFLTGFYFQDAYWTFILKVVISESALEYRVSRRLNLVKGVTLVLSEHCSVCLSVQTRLTQHQLNQWHDFEVHLSVDWWQLRGGVWETLYFCKTEPFWPLRSKSHTSAKQIRWSCSGVGRKPWGCHYRTSSILKTPGIDTGINDMLWSVGIHNAGVMRQDSG